MDRMSSRSASAGAARLMDLLALSEDELCGILDAGPLSVLSGQLDHRGELPILLDLIEDASRQAGSSVLKRWVRAGRIGSRPIDSLLRRDFGAFEDALARLAERGFVLRGVG
jgi:hypothetical protein